MIESIKSSYEDTQKAPIEQVDAIDFVCNCCQTAVRQCPIERIDREAPSCPRCGSTVRFRSIVHLLSMGLRGTSQALPDWPIDKSICGVGLSDWPGYGVGLARATDYTNTYFHKEPLFDIVRPRADYHNKFDYLISTEVFEHVVQPVSRAFDGARKVLRSGGKFVLTVPFSNDQCTREHFPDLNNYTIVELGGEHILVNLQKDGQIDVHRNLIFHGGPGTTLEMRVFCRGDVIALLENSGFIDIKVMDYDVPEFGILHKHPWSLPILARAA
jgi:hypothetical protein